MAIKKKKIEIHLLLILCIGIGCSNNNNFLNMIINNGDSTNVNFEKGKEMMNSEKFKAIQEFRRANTDEENSSFMLLEGGDTIS